MDQEKSQGKSKGKPKEKSKKDAIAGMTREQLEEKLRAWEESDLADFIVPDDDEEECAICLRTGTGDAVARVLDTAGYLEVDGDGTCRFWLHQGR